MSPVRAAPLIAKHVFFIVFDTVEVQKSEVLFLERILGVMFTLVGNIVNSVVHRGLTYGKHSITSLPGKFVVDGVYGFYPSAGVALDFFRNVGEANISR